MTPREKKRCRRAGGDPLILSRRDNYRRAFSDFDFHKVGRFNSRSVERLLGDAGTVRSRLKIESPLNNARMILKVRKERGRCPAP